MSKRLLLVVSLILLLASSWLWPEGVGLFDLGRSTLLQEERVILSLLLGVVGIAVALSVILRLRRIANRQMRIDTASQSSDRRLADRRNAASGSLPPGGQERRKSERRQAFRRDIERQGQALLEIERRLAEQSVDRPKDS